MIRLLLDTNAFAMALVDDPRLPQAARALLLEADGVFVSAISLYEIGQKVRLGKWPEMAEVAPELIDIAHRDHYQLLPLTPGAALRASLLDWAHRDPFDRMIAAIAQEEDLPVLSSDAAFDDLVGVERRWS